MNSGVIRAQDILRRFPQRVMARVRQYQSWGQKISAALVDQALFAGSNFVINVLLARWMSPQEYSAFVIAYAWFLLPQNLYDAVLIEPMSTYGAGKYAARFRRYLGFLYYGHMAVALLIALVLGGAAIFAYFFDSTVVAVALAGAAISSPMLLTRWLTRQPFYVQAVPHWSALGGLIYFILSLVGLFAIREMGILDPFYALIVLGVTGLIASIFLTVALIRPKFTGASDDGSESMTTREVLRDHWDYGKWASSSRLLMWVPSNIFYIMLPMLVGLTASGALRAMMNLVMPLLMAITAITGILLPSFVRAYARDGQDSLDRRVRMISRLMLAVTVGYCAFLVLLGKPVMHLIYNGQYDEFMSYAMLLAMGLIPVVSVVNTIIDTGLRACGGVKLSFTTKVLPAFLTVTAGMALVWAFGLIGAHLSAVGTGLVTLVLVQRAYATQGHINQRMATRRNPPQLSIRPLAQKARPLPADSPGVSIIMPAHNASRFIHAAIESILAQTYENFELIVVDDGSTDNTAAIVRDYMNRDTRIRLIQSNHGGVGRAGNLALLAAKYPWAARMDADDIAMPDRLEKQMRAALADPDVIVWGGYALQINVHDQVLGLVEHGPTNNQEYQELRDRGEPFFILNPTTMFRRDIALRLGGYNPRLTAAGDEELWSRMASFGKMRVLAEPLICYRIHKTSITATQFATQKQVLDFVRARNRAYRRGRDLSYEHYVAQLNRKPWYKRVQIALDAKGRYHYRQAGVELAEKNQIRALINMLIAVVLAPNFTLSRINERFQRQARVRKFAKTTA